MAILLHKIALETQALCSMNDSSPSLSGCDEIGWNGELQDNR